MAGSASDSMDEGHLDLVPMIDCIMLLLLFFMMTTKFSSEEKAISSLLPTDKGQAAAPQKQTDPPQMVNICIYPAGMTKGYTAADYLTQLNKLHLPGQVIGDAFIRIGNRDPITIPGGKLAAKGGPDAVDMQRLIDQIHNYIADELGKFEKPGQPRNKQNDILINCFSGLSWKFPLIVYDGVRAYEGKIGNIKYTGDPAQLLEARAVTFSPPRIRDYAANELGNELFEIIHTK